MRHAVSVKESHGHRTFDSEIDVLRNIASRRGNLHSVEFSDDNADHVPVPVKKRAAA